MKVFSTDKMVEKAMNSPRLRHILKCNQTYDERPQIFFNCLLEDTFIAPHNHELDPKTEYILLLEGDIAVIFFNTDGSVQEVKSFSSKKKKTRRPKAKA